MTQAPFDKQPVVTESRVNSHRMLSEIWPGERKKGEARKQLSQKPTQNGVGGPLVKDKSLQLGNKGYTIKRAKGKGAKGFSIIKNK